MKVTLQKDYRKFYTFEDMDRAKAVIASEKDDESTVASWAVYAINEVIGYLRNRKSADYSFAEESDVIRATATTAKNCRAWNEYGEGTQDMDVWIEALAFTGDCFIEIGAYLSDIWGSGATPYSHHVYYRVFAEAHRSWD